MLFFGSRGLLFISGSLARTLTEPLGAVSLFVATGIRREHVCTSISFSMAAQRPPSRRIATSRLQLKRGDEPREIKRRC